MKGIEMTIIANLTPGNIKKINRHIGEGRSIEWLKREMDIPMRDLREILDSGLCANDLAPIPKEKQRGVVDFGTGNAKGYNTGFYNKSLEKNGKASPEDIKNPPLKDGILNPVKAVEIIQKIGFETFQELISIAADIYGIPNTDITSRRRNSVPVAARQACIIAACAHWPCHSFPRLGRMFGVDHTVIMYVLNKFNIRREVRQLGGRKRFIEKLIRYVDEMAGNGFDDAEELMTAAFVEFNIKETQTPLTDLITRVNGAVLLEEGEAK